MILGLCMFCLVSAGTRYSPALPGAPVLYLGYGTELSSGTSGFCVSNKPHRFEGGIRNLFPAVVFPGIGTVLTYPIKRLYSCWDVVLLKIGLIQLP